MAGGSGRKGARILAERGFDRGLARAILVSVVLHVVILVGLFLAGDLDLRPRALESYAVGLVGGLPGGMEESLPALGAPALPAARERRESVPPRAKRAAPAAAEARSPKRSDEPVDVILPGGATATPVPTATPTPTPAATASPAPSTAPTPTVAAKASPTPTLAAQASPTPTLAAQASPTPTLAAQASPTPAAAARASPAPTAAATASPAPSAAPTPAPTPSADRATTPGVARKSPSAADSSRSPRVNPNATPQAEGSRRSEVLPADAPESDSLSPSAEDRERDARIAAAMDRVRSRLAGAPGTAGGVPGGSGGGHGAGGGGSADSLRGADFLAYYDQMLARIRDAWVWTGGGSERQVEVAFGINARGEIIEVRILTPSGEPSFDQSVLRALRAVRNLGPPPDRHLETFSQVELTFRPSDLEPRP